MLYNGLPLLENTMAYKGSIVALVTPMHADGSIALDPLKQLIDFQIKAGTSALLILGTTGESPTLTHDEKTAIIKTSIEHAAGRIPIIVGTGSNCTASSIAMTKEAESLGANAALLVNPYYNKPTQEGLYQHYKAIAEQCSIPQIIYNIPGRTCGDVHPETVIRLAKHDNIIGIKECSGDFTRIKQLRAHCPDDFYILSGDDDNLSDFIPAGGDGIFSVAGNIAPKLTQEHCQALLNKDTEKTKKLRQEIQPLFDTLFIESNPIPCKWALTQMGFIPPGIRLPLLPLSQAASEPVLKALRTLKLITDIAL
jgi:4-hydroxy-tetrahydrodipicolinate synthase